LFGTKQSIAGPYLVTLHIMCL